MKKLLKSLLTRHTFPSPKLSKSWRSQDLIDLIQYTILDGYINRKRTGLNVIERNLATNGRDTNSLAVLGRDKLTNTQICGANYAAVDNVVLEESPETIAGGQRAEGSKGRVTGGEDSSGLRELVEGIEDTSLVQSIGEVGKGRLRDNRRVID